MIKSSSFSYLTSFPRTTHRYDCVYWYYENCSGYFLIIYFHKQVSILPVYVSGYDNNNF